MRRGELKIVNNNNESVNVNILEKCSDVQISIGLHISSHYYYYRSKELGIYACSDRFLKKCTFHI